MGAAESNVDLFKLRTAKRGRSWSKKGLEAVLHTLGLLYEGILHNSIRQLDLSLEEADTEELISMSASKVAKTVGRKVLGVRQAGFPAINRGFMGYAKLFRGILNLDPLGIEIFELPACWCYDNSNRARSRFLQNTGPGGWVGGRTLLKSNMNEILKWSLCTNWRENRYVNLVNKQVKHGVFGKGKVVQHDDLYIQVDFASGIKKFVYPDAFGSYLTLVDQKAANLIGKVVEKREREKEHQRLERIEALKNKTRQNLLEQERLARRRKTVRINPRSQSVFWCELQELDTIFEEGKVFTGEIKSGRNKGQPNRLAQISQNSACLLTVREPDVPEKERRISGVFVVSENFVTGRSTDGFIPAHSKYRLRLSEKESGKMLFWNYYVNKRYPHRTTWNTGRHRYFDNIWMAQILRDIVSLKKTSEEQEFAQRFFDHFCQINRIDQEELPEPNGALKRA